jgi:hypothetical protein
MIKPSNEPDEFFGRGEGERRVLPFALTTNAFTPWSLVGETLVNLVIVFTSEQFKLAILTEEAT